MAAATPRKNLRSPILHNFLAPSLAAAFNDDPTIKLHSITITALPAYQEFPPLCRKTQKIAPQKSKSTIANPAPIVQQIPNHSSYSN